MSHSYNQAANRYVEKFMAHEPYEKQVRAFAQFLHHGESTLDIGCGPGNVARQ
jgi:ubiquinone/menaquinone biosynthesis C-methylase UbiE